MDLADEIAYAAHDLEDALSRNMVTIEDIEYEFQISDEFRERGNSSGKSLLSRETPLFRLTY